VIPWGVCYRGDSLGGAIGVIPWGVLQG